MSISISYNNDLSRVHIELTGLSEDVVRVQRSHNELLWETVRGGRSLQIVDGDASLDDYEFFANGTVFYRVLDAEDLDGGSVEEDDITVDLEEVWLKSIRYPMLNQTVEIQDYSDIAQNARGVASHIAGRSLPTGMVDVSTGMEMDLVFNAEEEEQVRRLRLSLAVGESFFLHIPPELHPGLPPRSFYFIRSQTRTERWLDHLDRRLLHIPVQEVNPPTPEIVGATLTWGTIRRLYGSWTAVLDTWGDLMDVVGDPEDLVVL